MTLLNHVALYPTTKLRYRMRPDEEHSRLLTAHQITISNVNAPIDA